MITTEETQNKIIALIGDITALVPFAIVTRYAMDLKAMTGDRFIIALVKAIFSSPVYTFTQMFVCIIVVAIIDTGKRQIIPIMLMWMSVLAMLYQVYIVGINSI